MFAARRRKVVAGDVFAARPNDGRGYIHGQVLRDDVNLAGAVLLLVVFFDGRSSAPGLPCAELSHARLIARPFVTNKTGWFHGRFATLQNCVPVDCGRIGLRAMSTDAVYDVAGQRCEPKDFDTFGYSALSPYGAIALALAPHLG